MQTIIELVHALEAYVGQSPYDLLKAGYPALCRVLKDATVVRVYQVLPGHELELLLPSRGASNLTLTDATAPYYDAAREFWVLPLIHAGETLGLVEANCTADHSVEHLELVAWHVAEAWYETQLDDILRREAAANRALNSAQTFAHMTHAIAANICEPGEFIAINLMTRDADGRPNGFETIASGNRHRGIVAEGARLEMSPEEFEDGFGSVYQEGLTIYDQDIANSPIMGETTRAWLATLNIKATCILPLWSGGRVFAFMGLNSTRGRLDLQLTKLSAYERLAAQVSALVQTLRLLETSAINEDITQRQQQATQALTSAQDYAAMALVIARNMLPQKGRFLSINRFSYNADKSKVSQTNVLASANRNKANTVNQVFDWDAENIGAAMLATGRPFFVADREAVREQINNGLYEWMLASEVNNMLFVPMLVEQQPFGIITVMSREPAHYSAQEENAFIALANQVAALILTRELLEEAQKQRENIGALTLANRMISMSKNVSELPETALYTIGKHYHALGITEFKMPLDGSAVPLGSVFISSATAQGTRNGDGSVQTQDLPTASDVAALMSGKPVVIDPLNQQPSPRRQPYLDLGATWLASFGLRAGDRLVGTLDVAMPESYTFAPTEIDLWVTLADQIGTTIYSRQFLDQSREAQSFATKLLTSNRAISEAAGYDAIGLAVIQTVPSSIHAVALALFDRAVTNYGMPNRMETHVIVTRDTSAEPKTIDRFASKVSQEDARLSMLMTQLLKGQPWQSKVKIKREHPMGNNMLTTLGEMGMAAFTALALNVGQRMMGLLVFAATQEVMELSAQQLDTLRSIADQVAVTLENRDLLRQTSEALTFVQTQYEITSKINRAESMVQMLSAAFEFAEGRYADANLGRIYEQGANPTVQLLAEATLKDGVTPSSRIVPLKDYPIAEGMMAMEVLNITDVNKSRFLNAEESKSLQARGISAVLGFPLMSGATMVGVLLFTNTKPTDLANNRVRALRSVADQIAIKFENQRLFEDTRAAAATSAAQVRTLESLNRLSTQIPTIRNPKELMKLAARTLVEALAADHAGVVMLNESGRTGTVVAEYPQQGVEDQQIDMSDVFQRELRSTLRPTLITDVVNDRRINETTRQVLQNLGIITLAIFPLTNSEGKFIGSASVDLYDRQRRFTPTMMDVANSVVAQISVGLQNILLLQDAEERTEQLSSQVRALEMLNEMATIITSRRNERKLFEDSALALVRALDVDHCGIVLFDPSGTMGRVAGEYPKQGTADLEMNMEADPIHQQLRQTRQPVFVEDIDTFPNVRYEMRETWRKFNIRSMLVLPLNDTSGKMVGSVGLDIFSTDKQITPDMIDVAMTISTQIGVGMQNIRLLQDAERRAEQLQRVAALSQSLQATLDQNRIYQAMVNETSQMVNCTFMTILIYDVSRDQWRAVAQHYRGKTVVDTEQAPAIRTAGTPTARVVQDRQFVYVPDLMQETTMRHQYSEARSLMLAPIFARGQIRGVVEVGYNRSNSYTEADMLVFQQMVSQLNVAIENAEAFVQTQKSADNKALANQISTHLQRQNRIEDMLNVTVTELGKALGAKKARVRLSKDDKPKFDAMPERNPPPAAPEQN